MTRLLVILLLLCPVWGCSTHRVPPPEVSLVDVNVKDLSVFQTTVHLDVQIQNVSNKPLRVESGTHRVWINDISLGRGFHEKSFTVQPFRSSKERVVFHVSNLSFFSRLQRLLEGNSLEYRIESELVVPGGTFGSQTVTTESADTLWQSKSS